MLPLETQWEDSTGKQRGEKSGTKARPHTHTRTRTHTHTHTHTPADTKNESGKKDS